MIIEFSGAFAQKQELGGHQDPLERAPRRLLECRPVRQLFASSLEIRAPIVFGHRASKGAAREVAHDPLQVLVGMLGVDLHAIRMPGIRDLLARQVAEQSLVADRRPLA